MSSNSSSGYRSMKNPKGYAVLAGLKRVDPAAYGGWTGEAGCWGCELDVDNMAKILSPLGYKVAALKTEAATAENILSALLMAAKMARAGDIVVFYYSGHGGTEVDVNGDEIDRQDETLIAFNRPILDDELAPIWNQFAKGVRIVMASDSCHSGTNFRALGGQPVRAPALLGEAPLKGMKAQLIHMGGCRDEGTSAGYTGGGAFTMALCDIWDNGAFAGNYDQLLNKIAARVASTQIPQYNEYGPISASFRGQRPFTVKAPVSVALTSPEPVVSSEVAPEVPAPAASAESAMVSPAALGTLKEALIQAIADVFDRFEADSSGRGRRIARRMPMEREMPSRRETREMSETRATDSSNGASVRA